MQTVYDILKNKGRKARIAVMRYRFIGDTLLTVPFLKALRSALPEAEIDVFVAPNSGEVLAHCPYFNRLIFWDTSRKHRYENPLLQSGAIETRRPQNFWQSAQILRAGRYDAVFVLKRSFSSALLAFLAGIPLRVGFNTEARGLFLTHRIAYEMDRHEIDCYLDHLRLTGFPESCFEESCQQGEPALEMFFEAGELEQARETILPYQGKLNILLHLTSSNTAKQWPDEAAKTLLSWLLEQPDVHVHFMGAQSDASLYERLKSELAAQYAGDAALFFEKRLHNWCGQFSIRQSAAVLKHLQLAIGVDSGTMHLARAVEVPSIVLFGPMSEIKWRPPGANVLTHPVDCHPCHLKTPCHREFSCIRDLSADAVIEEAKRQLALIKLKL
ncbi:MAG: glycosyltransferase family 9 protein [Vampirovibrionales bacterium]|nr:glycosyltransferase family 9 protein [Vampirovibrionales bacterium]